MNKLLMFLLMLTLVLPLFATDKEWYDFTEGMNISTQQNKQVIIDFYTDWCRWCKVMDKNTFSDPQVEAYLFENFVPIRINAESTAERVKFQGNEYNFRELTTAFQVEGFPSVAFLTENQELITVIPGYIEKETFLNILKYMQSKCWRYQLTLEEFIKSGCDEAKKK